MSISSARELVSTDVTTAVSTYLTSERGVGDLVVGVSGGRDSVALGAALAASASTRRVRFAHVHHHLRGADADADADLVVRLGAELGVATTVLHVDVPAYCSRENLSTLTAARYLRYQSLGRLVAEVEADALVVAHTLDDHLETLVLHILRGAGIHGLVGMQATATVPRHAFGVDAEGGGVDGWTSLRIHRPLLSVRRGATEAYCRERGLEFRDDPSNQDEHYRRVWVREHLLPLLRLGSPRAEAALAALAVSAAETESALGQAISMRWQGIVQHEANGVSIDLAALASLPRQWRPHVLLRTFREALPSSDSLARVHVLALERLASGNGPSKRVALPHGMLAERHGGTLTIRSRAARDPDSASSVPFALHLPIPGTIKLPDGRLVRSVVARPPRRFRHDDNVVWLDSRVAGDSLLVRTRLRGDRYQLLGAAGSKRLKDLLIDRKIPRRERDRLPVLVANGDVVWVAGLRVAERARVPEQATCAVRVELVHACDKTDN